MLATYRAMLTNAQLPKPENSSWIRSMMPPVVLAALLIVAITKWVEWQPAFLRPSWNEVFHMENGAWQRLPELPGEPQKLQVSTGGAVWALIWNYGVGNALARLDGPSWRM